jgi:hypothetical protein
MANQSSKHHLSPAGGTISLILIVFLSKRASACEAGRCIEDLLVRIHPPILISEVFRCQLSYIPIIHRDSGSRL